MEQDKCLETGRQSSSGLSVWRVVGGAVLVLVAAGVIVALPDIKRYVKISTM